MTDAKSTCAAGIPLYLIPQAITRLIRTRGEKVYRISVVRTHYHHYNISVRTRLMPRELRVREQFPAQDYAPVRSDDDCEGGVA
jgi:hypothetical protein